MFQSVKLKVSWKTTQNEKKKDYNYNLKINQTKYTLTTGNIVE